ncbi:MAG: hypothetical protein JST90_17380 [Bacteroidetes bacterium]|nr:hypothetical protein [Bacteroidota bacterium]
MIKIGDKDKLLNTRIELNVRKQLVKYIVNLANPSIPIREAKAGEQPDYVNGEDFFDIQIEFPQSKQFFSQGSLFLQTAIRKGLTNLNEQIEDWSNEMFSEEQRQKIQEYINVFRLKIGSYLKPSVGQKFEIAGFPEGVIINLHQDPYIANEDKFLGNKASLKEAFASVSADWGKFILHESIMSEPYQLKDTKIYINDSILILKTNDPSQWNSKRVEKDVDDIRKYMSSIFKK